MSSKKIIIMFLTVFVLLCAVFGILYLSRDSQPPVITFPEEEAVFNGDEGKLLDGVTAFDNKDGDVSASLRVASVLYSPDRESVSVTYAARDARENVAQKIRVMALGEHPKASAEPEPAPEPTASPSPTPSPTPNPEAPVIKLVSDSVDIGADENYYIIEFVESITDNRDSSEVLYQSIDVFGEYDLSVPGTYHVEFVVTDSDGYQSEPAPLTINVQ